MEKSDLLSLIYWVYGKQNIKELYDINDMNVEIELYNGDMDIFNPYEMLDVIEDKRK